MSREVIAEVAPGATRVRSILGELIDLPRKVVNYLREKVNGKALVRFLVDQHLRRLVAVRVLSVEQVEEFDQGGIVIITIPETGRLRRPVKVLYGSTYAGSEGAGCPVVIQGRAMIMIAEMARFRPGPWAVKLYLEPARYRGEYVVSEPTQIRAFLGRPFSSATIVAAAV